MLTFVIFVALAIGVQSVDWCKMESQFCGGREHIACEPNAFPYATNVRNVEVIPMTDSLKQMIVNTHNKYRSRVAKGQERGIPAAADMEKVSWNADLQTAAAFHVKHAKFQHDSCRAFTGYPNPGQNIALSTSSVPFSNVAATVEGHINSWYSTEMPYVRDKKSSCTGKFTSDCMPAGHYTCMVNGKNDAVGCAVVKFEEKNGLRWWYRLMTTCDYTVTNFLNLPVYTAGTTCSKCSSAGKSCDSASGLCV
ncbi:antigen 5 like allergen Cul n 1-like [Lutzomyia longipalpis]|uniref:antigen 5 like allergen Cul n 1-like n=1 Tax=Lutzomyia longipalpis TaxID=7200 RepID=UPI002483D8CE|nr:antigen 5 like allergen Cul n 1-like [Lutzomyia longipalpis]